MPAKSKIRTPRSVVKPGESKPKQAAPRPDKFQCIWCGEMWAVQKSHFPASHSPLYRGNGGYLTICYDCVDNLLKHYTEALGSEAEAMRRICQKFDVYWHYDIYDAVPKLDTSKPRARKYLTMTNLKSYIGKTYDDTIEEERYKDNPMYAIRADADGDMVTTDVPAPTPETIEFWGPGFDSVSYYDLNMRYNRWTKNLPKPLDLGTEAIYKQVCILEMTSNRNASVGGKGVEATAKQIGELLAILKERPDVKQQASDSDEEFGRLPFGVGIRILENERPVPEPQEELKDVDGLVRLVTVYFLGHLCKMVGIKNTYCQMYEEEMARLRIERPDISEDEDDETAFNDIFAGMGESGGDI